MQERVKAVKQNLLIQYNQEEEYGIDLYFRSRFDLWHYVHLFTRDVEPNYNYCEKFFIYLIDQYKQFTANNTPLLLLEASPRTGKTEFNILYLTHLIGNSQRKKFLIVAGVQTLKNKLKRSIDRICNTNFFYKVFGATVLRSNESQMIFSNGCSIDFKTTNSQVPTGEGYHFIFLIDFLNRTMVESVAKKEHAFDQLKGILSRTQNDPSTKLFIDNQRLAVEDLSSLITSQYDMQNVEYTRLTFPYKFENESQRVLSNGKVIVFKEGDFLVSRFNGGEWQKILANLGTIIAETEYQQKPRAITGMIIKREFFRFYKQIDLGQPFKRIFITTDQGLTENSNSDYSVFCCWGLNRHNQLYLLDFVRMKATGLAVDKALFAFIDKWKVGFNNGHASLSSVIIEKVGTTSYTRDNFRKHLGGARLKEVSRKASKVNRLLPLMGILESGRVYLPSNDVVIDGVDNTTRDIAIPFINECEAFTSDGTHKHDDIVDNLIDAMDEIHQVPINLSFTMV